MLKISRNIILNDLQKIFDSDIDWSIFYNKTILITGASGFLPAYLVEIFLYVNRKNPEANINLIALVRNKEKAVVRFEHLIDDPNLLVIEQDVCEPVEIENDIDFIIHAASQASPKYYGVDPVGTINANVIGTSNLLKLAYKKKVQGFLYFSSSEVYGNLDDDKIPTSENWFGSIDPCNVRSCYSEGKRAGESLCISWHHQFKIPINIVRPFHTYGPGMSLDDGRVYADFIRDIVLDNDIQMLSDGSAIRAFCYISDATEAFIKILINKNFGNAYNVGNDNCVVSIIELAEILIRLFPEKKLKVIKKEIKSNEYIKSQISKNIPNIEKVKKIGWKPKITIEEGFIRTIKYYL